MRRLAVIVIAASAVSCTNPQNVAEQAQLPALDTATNACPHLRASSGEGRSSTSARWWKLSFSSSTTDPRHQGQKTMPSFRVCASALATKEKDLSAFFARAYGKRGRAEHDKYITELANLQSQRVLKSGDRFCSISSSMFDQVMPLSTVEQLATYAQSKPVQQALAVDDCPAAPTPRGKGRRTASLADPESSGDNRRGNSWSPRRGYIKRRNRHRVSVRACQMELRRS